MFTDVKLKIRRKNKILFSRESESLQGLRNLICQQTHLTLVLWALDCVQIPLQLLMGKYPQETDILAAHDCSLAWAHGEIKMPVAKKAILACHGVAKRMSDAADIALCHAIGQGCSAVHVETHAMGLAFYELTAIVVQCGYENFEERVLDKIDFYIGKLIFWQDNAETCRTSDKWADFLLRSADENKEKLLNM